MRAQRASEKRSTGSAFVRPHARGSELVGFALHKANAVPIGIPHVHLAIIPALICGINVDGYLAAGQFRMQAVEVINDERRDAARYAVPKKRRDMEDDPI